MKVKLIPKSLYTKRTVILQIGSEELRQAIMAEHSPSGVVRIAYEKPHVKYVFELT